MNLPDKYPKLLAEMIGFILPILIENSIDPERAEHVAFSITEEFRDKLHGSFCYFGKGQAMMLSERDHAMWNDFTGKNIEELIRKYKVSRVWVYKVVNRMRAADTTQGDLFRGGGEEL